MGSLIPARPKGMHENTYGRLRSEILNAEIATEERLAIFVERMMRSDRRTAGRSRKEFWV